MQQNLIQHGEFELSVKGNVLIACLKGGWNEVAARNFDRCLRETAQPLLGKNWGHLVCLEDWSLGVPEMVPIVEDLVQWCIDNGLKCAAHVYSASMMKKLTLDDMVVEKQGDFQRHHFSNKAEATRWLAQQGFETGE